MQQLFLSPFHYHEGAWHGCSPGVVRQFECGEVALLYHSPAVPAGPLLVSVGRKQT